MPRLFHRKSGATRNAFAAPAERISALALGLLAGVVFLTGLIMTDAHSMRALFVADEHGFVALGALFVMFAGLFAIVAFAMEIPPDDGPAGFRELKPARLSARPKRRS